MSLQDDSLNHEAERLAESTLHAFNNVMTILDRNRQLRAAKHLLKNVRTLVETLEKDICQPSSSA